MRRDPLKELLTEVRDCKACSPHLPLGANPILRAHSDARILLIGQAPGTRVHATGIPWNDPSGDKLRDWLGVDRNIFYDEKIFAIIPMGFCYPGKGKARHRPETRGGDRAGRPQGWRTFDLPPRAECAPLWHAKLHALLPNIQLTLLIGSYAVRRYLPQQAKLAVSELVHRADFTRGKLLPLVHPSPRNKLWLKRNPWFEAEVVPKLRQQIAQILAAP